MKKLQQSHVERITRKWWFFLSFVLLQFVVPPYASRGYKFPEEWGNVIAAALRYAFIYSHSDLFPVFKIIPVILIVLIIVLRNRVTRFFNIYVAFSYVLFAFGQNIAVTEKYGVAICTVNVIMFLAVACFWAWEAIALQNNFSPSKIPIRRYWIVPLMFLAFWYPAGFETMKPDFNFLGLFTNVAGVTFCMMTPVYVGLLNLYWPNVNISTLRVTSLVGLIIALYNVLLNFCIDPGLLWWNGVLHIPLLSISLYGLILSLKKQSRRTQINERIE